MQGGELRVELRGEIPFFQHLGLCFGIALAGEEIEHLRVIRHMKQGLVVVQVMPAVVVVVTPSQIHLIVRGHERIQLRTVLHAVAADPRRVYVEEIVVVQLPGFKISKQLIAQTGASAEQDLIGRRAVVPQRSHPDKAEIVFPDVLGIVLRTV